MPRLHCDVWTLKFIIIFGNVDNIGDRTFSFEALSIDGAFAEIRLNILERTQMPAALATLTNAEKRIMMGEIAIIQFVGGFG